MTFRRNSKPRCWLALRSIDGTRVSVPPQHRLFLRTVAAAFDTHFVAAPNRHAKAV